jgi:hypothetical protein
MTLQTTRPTRHLQGIATKKWARRRYQIESEKPSVSKEATVVHLTLEKVEGACKWDTVIRLQLCVMNNQGGPKYGHNDHSWGRSRELYKT